MKRVLFACSELEAHGGIQRFNRNLLQALMENNAYIDVVSLNDDVGKKENLYSLFPANKNKVKWILILFRCFLLNRYDVVVCGHINLSPAFQLVRSLFFLRGCDSVLILHGIDVWGRVTGLKKYFSKYFNKILSVSRYTENSFIQQVGRQSNIDFHIFPNTISPDWSLSNAELSDLMVNESHKEKSNINLLSVTRLDKTEREKGIVDVLTALGMLKDKGLGKFNYCVVGNGDDKDYLAQLSVELGISEEVKFLGSISDEELFLQYKKANVFVLPSSKEGFGIVFLEAMLFGLPVIGASEKGALDVIEDGVNGHLVPYGNPDKLYEVIYSYYRSPEIFDSLGDKGYRMVTGDGKFSFSSFVYRVNDYLLS